jgi:hypothetical protein
MKDERRKGGDKTEDGWRIRKKNRDQRSEI